MSSLLQFHGNTSRRGVGLQFVLRADDAAWNDPPAEPFTCLVCGREHERIHVAYRVPRGTINRMTIRGRTDDVRTVSGMQRGVRAVRAAR